MKFVPEKIYYAPLGTREIASHRISELSSRYGRNFERAVLIASDGRIWSEGKGSGAVISESIGATRKGDTEIDSLVDRTIRDRGLILYVDRNQFEQAKRAIDRCRRYEFINLE